MSSIGLSVEAHQRLGRRRNQQDRYVVLGSTGGITLCGVLDGVGGNQDGDLAADAGLAEVARTFLGQATSELEKVVNECLLRSNEAVACLRDAARAAGVPAQELPATTVVLAVFDPGGRVAVGWQGDSLAVLETPGQETLVLTPPHNASTDVAWRDAHPGRSGGAITRFVGSSGGFGHEMWCGTVRPGQIVALLSDGAWSELVERGFELGTFAEWFRGESSSTFDDNATAIFIRMDDPAGKASR